MPIRWNKKVQIDDEEITPHDWLKTNWQEFTAREAAQILSTAASGTIGESGIRKHLKGKLGLAYGQGVDHARQRQHPPDGVPDNGKMFQGIAAADIVSFIRRKQVATLTELSNRFDRSQSTIESILWEMISAGYSVKRDHQKVLVQNFPTVDFEPKPLFPTGHVDEICFALISDTHAGSHCEQVTAVNDLIHVAYEEYGVKNVLHAGDIFAGCGVYRGQAQELYAVSGKDQAYATAHNLPQRPGLRYFVLGGNHDYSFFKAAGLDARRELLLLGREDITLLAYDAATVPLMPDIDVHLWHPSGGVPYALSYRGQKGVEQLAQDELMQVVMGDKLTPTIRLVLIGHLHVQYMFDYGPMVVLGAGCFEGQNSYLKRKKLVPHVGGWILRCRFVDGMLHRLEPIRIRYRELEDDWKPWRAKFEGQRQVEVLQPIFSMEE